MTKFFAIVCPTVVAILFAGWANAAECTIISKTISVDSKGRTVIVIKKSCIETKKNVAR